MGLKTGTLIVSIDGKETEYRYINHTQRSSLIENAMLRRLEDKVCYYTIQPSHTPLKPKYTHVKEKLKASYGASCSVTVANQMRLLYRPYHDRLSRRKLAKLFGVKHYLAYRILHDFTNRP